MISLPPSVLALLALNAGLRAAAATRTRAVRSGSFQRSPIASTEYAGEDGTNRPTPAMRLSREYSYWSRSGLLPWVSSAIQTICENAYGKFEETNENIKEMRDWFK